MDDEAGVSAGAIFPDSSAAVLSSLIDGVEFYIMPIPSSLVEMAFLFVMIDNPLAGEEASFFGCFPLPHPLHDHNTAAIEEVSFAPSG